MKSRIHITQEEWDLIEAHLDDQSVSKASLLNIPQFEEKINHIQTIREDIEDSIRKSKIRQFHSQDINDKSDPEVKTVSNKKSISKVPWYAMAAVLVIAFGIFWMMERPSASERLFVEHFKPDIGLPLKMGTTNSNAFYEGMVAYKQENYKSAIDQWLVLLNDSPKNDTLHYFLGVSYLAEGNADTSLEYLQNQEQFKQSVFKEDAAYYAALAHLKKGNIGDAKALLNKQPSTRNKTLLDLLD